MAVLRNPSKEKFTVVDNAALRDGNLSLKARGLLVTMLSLPDNWKFSENGLCSIFQKDGQASVRSGLKELEESGYLVRARERDSFGRVTNVSWTIYDYPHLENSSVDNPNLDNRTQLNTKESNTKERNTNSFVSASAPLDFDRFWKAYPLKKAKQAALKAWKKINPDKQLAETIIAAVEKQKRWDDWTRDNGQYIPHPATWLNQGRWEDEERKRTRQDEGPERLITSEEAHRSLERAQRDAEMRRMEGGQ